MTRMVAAAATSMARDGVPNLVCRNASRSDSAPSTDSRWSSCSASLKREVRRRHAAAAPRRRRARPRRHRAPTMVLQDVAPARRGARSPRAAWSARGHEQDEQERSATRWRASAKIETRRLVRCSACRRGGRSSCAARATASPPPMVGSASAKPTRQASAMSIGGQPRDARRQRAATRASPTSTGPRTRLTRPQTVMTVRIPTAIHTPARSGPTSGPGRSGREATGARPGTPPRSSRSLPA